MSPFFQTTTIEIVPFYYVVTPQNRAKEVLNVPVTVYYSINSTLEPFTDRQLWLDRCAELGIEVEGE